MTDKLNTLLNLGWIS